jgi:hypothetical protein
MHAIRTSRVSNFDNKPLHSGSPSRTASLQHSSHLRNQIEKCNFTTISRPANATTSKDAPASAIQQLSTRHMSLQMKDIPLEFLTTDLRNIHPAFRDASTGVPGSGRSRPRSTSCCVSQRNPMLAARVNRWSGLTRTVSHWDGLRKVSTRMNCVKILLTTYSAGLRAVVRRW